MADDACTKKIKRQYKVWPSARASQAVAKCRKSKGQVRKGKKGKSLRRWAKEKWVDKKTGKPCGAKTNKAQYCRPTKVVSKKKTPTTRPSKKQTQEALFRKRAGKRAPSRRTPKRKY